MTLSATDGVVRVTDASQRAPETNDTVEASLPTAGVFDELSGVVLSVRAALSNFFDLMALEARRAGHALIWMVAFALVATICVLAAWLGFMAVLVMWAVYLGLPLIAAMLTIAVINCIAGAALIYLFIGRTHDLLFSVTRRQLAASLPIKSSPP